MHDAVFDTIARAVARTFHCDAATVRQETEASDINGWDSLSHVFLVMAIEDELRIKLPLDELMECANVGELAALARTALSE